MRSENCNLALGLGLGTAALYLFALAGRRNHPGMEKLRGWSYAHRGLHGDGVPENSMAAFRAALENGFGIELDVHLLQDGGLGVMHDSALKRTTGREGRMEALTTAQLADYTLEGTGETIPAFAQVLALFAGKAPLIIELKTAGDNVDALCRTVCQALEGYEGPYCIESFDPRCVRWLRVHRPDIIRGQLAENFLRSGQGFPKPFLWAMRCNLLDFYTRPDFIAYQFADRRTLSNCLCRKLLGIQGVSWTLCCREDYDTAVREGWLPIFEGFRP